MSSSARPSAGAVKHLVFSIGSAGFNLLERFIVLYIPFYYLPPAEYGVPSLVPEQSFLGIATVLGLALIVGRVIDALADPIIASLSDRSRSPLGRRRAFLLYSGLPLAVLCALLFFPPAVDATSLLNGVWLGAVLALFYVAYTGYVNPYLALISDLGKDEEERLRMGTGIAVSGMLATLVVTAGVPEFARWLSTMGVSLRGSYQVSVLLVATAALGLLYVATCGFREPEPKDTAAVDTASTWRCLLETFQDRQFRVYVSAEVLLQYGLNIMTMGLMFYVVVIFRRSSGFLTPIAAAMAVVAALSIPVINRVARLHGKRYVFVLALGVMIFCSSGLFMFSFAADRLPQIYGSALLIMMGIPLAAFAMMINPSVAEMARNHTLATGVSREAMYFAARAIPVKFVIAAAGATFSFLLAAFGKDLARPLGVQLSLLVVALASLASIAVFLRMPDDRSL